MRTAMPSSYVENFVYLRSQIPIGDCTTTSSLVCINLKQAFSSVSASCFVEIEKNARKSQYSKEDNVKENEMKVDYEN